jgi:hypothetical protein
VTRLTRFVRRFVEGVTSTPSRQATLPHSERRSGVRGEIESEERECREQNCQMRSQDSVGQAASLPKSGTKNAEAGSFGHEPEY